MFEISNDAARVSEGQHSRFRKSGQSIMPFWLGDRTTATEGYDMYPAMHIGSGKVQHGYDSLATWISQYPTVIIDGFSGVLWNEVRNCLDEAFTKEDKRVKWIDTHNFLKTPAEIEHLVTPFLGERDSVWGTKTSLKIGDYFNLDKLQSLQPDKGFDTVVIIGPGAALATWNAPVVYLDVPKNEIQYRMRARSVVNLGMSTTDDPSHMYKQYYFVDWVVLSQHRQQINDRLAVQADVQWERHINWMFANELSESLFALTQTVLRVRPWFEPGAWGGQWMKERIEGLNKEEINYAWSFELIVPENGLVFESDGYLLEVPFDLLMTTHAKKVLGKHADFFGQEFPIRFDFLDTWNGGNLSIQCHPSLQYIRENFGEHITQDETYYILDCKKDAKVYLGFQEGVEPKQFRQVLENSKTNGEEIDIEKYVQVHTASKHDLYLIPNGTVHSAGADNLVLEISSTPYIFTFKMYDWLRLDLNGEPRAINIEHAYNNLQFERQGARVAEELISKPHLLEKSNDVELWHVPTHAEHFYDVHRIEFDGQATVQTTDSCHVLMLVEGESVLVKTGDREQVFQYAETFVIPASVKEYTIVNQGRSRAKVVKAFIKSSIDQLK